LHHSIKEVPLISLDLENCETSLESGVIVNLPGNQYFGNIDFGYLLFNLALLEINYVRQDHIYFFRNGARTSIFEETTRLNQ
jgi:hypothetical protein